MPFFAHFEIDLVSALAEQLVTAFAELERGGLTTENIALVPAGQGVYHLFLDGILVYVGKADNLRTRLSQHRRKIEGRKNIDVADVTFNCLTVHKNWTALAPETSLIGHYKTQPGVCEWNGNGFGIHDPGRERETTNKPPDGFDSQYPIHEEWVCDFVAAGNWNVRELLIRMKEELPFLLRYAAVNKNYRSGHADYNNVSLTVPQIDMPAVDLLRLIAQRLAGWQGTRFPSHMILYKEKREYVHGTVIWHQPSDS